MDPEPQMSIRQLESTKLGVVSLKDGNKGIHWVNGAERAVGYDVVVSWQNGSSSFAILAPQPGRGKSAYVAGVEASSAEWHSIAVLDEHRLSPDGLPIEVTNIGWLRDGTAAVRVVSPRARQNAPSDAWWAVSGESATPLTAEDEASLKEGTLPDPGATVKLRISDTDRLYETDVAGHDTTIFPNLNPQLAEIEAPRSTSFEYRSAGGETVHANVLLPHGYVEGKRYPIVVWLYGGDVHSGDEKPAQRDDGNFLNLMLLTGYGYAVLIPSMPLSPFGVPGDPMLHLNDGVDPAVDRAVELGIADPNRLVVMGHSYGGYSVFGLLTQTHRYRAGVGMMGISDLVAQYTEFHPHYRYSDPNWAANTPFNLESAWGRMGVPLWVDPERYVRNSPVFAANKITTPLLIISGDVDFLGNQSEEMFTVLSRQGKRAEFVRYLGEDHNLKSPANILDMWQRVFAWLDKYVKDGGG
jgi:acetyl esterase/lipase